MMGEPEAPDECGVCGDELDDDYHVETYEVENPIQSGYLNPCGIPGVFYALFDLGPHELHLPVCKHCDAPETPPTPEIRPHRYQLLQTTLGAVLMGYGALSGVANDVTMAAAAAIIFAAGTAGEVLQHERIQARDEPLLFGNEPRLANPSTPKQRVHEAYLDGEVGEAELEEFLDAEYDGADEDELDTLVAELLADTEERDREPERVMER